MDNREALIRLAGISKHYGGVKAVDCVSISITRGEIHALVGENGAGKSTLGKVIAGSVPPNEGTIEFDGEIVQFSSPRQALSRGIAMLDQELAMVPDRSVLDNVFLGSELSSAGFLRKRDQRNKYEELVERSGFDLDPDVAVGRLRTADQQKVEILRALARDARLIVMDEPTAPLTPHEAGQLYGVVRDLRQAGTTIVFVSHFLQEVLDLADSVTVMRDGRLVQTSPAREETPTSLVAAMLGRSMSLGFPERRPPKAAEPVFELKELSSPGRFEGVSLSLCPGEILAMAGLVGSGKSEIARAVFGMDPDVEGEVLVGSRSVKIRSPVGAIKHGIGLIPESRKDDGLVMMRSVTENMSLPHLRKVSRSGFVRPLLERTKVGGVIEQVDVRSTGADAAVSTLSGGNQQKVLIGKWLIDPPRVLIADEPTRGVDVGAKRAIYELLTSLAASGMAILLISSEIEEVLGLSHRVAVLRRGRISAMFSAGEASEERVLAAAFGTEGES